MGKIDLLGSVSLGKGTEMKNMSDRERGFEAKFSQDQELDFRFKAYLYRLFADWIASELGLFGEEKKAYVARVVDQFVETPQHDHVMSLIMSDIEKSGLDFQAKKLEAKIEELRPIAQKYILGD